MGSRKDWENGKLAGWGLAEVFAGARRTDGKLSSPAVAARANPKDRAAVGRSGRNHDVVGRAEPDLREPGGLFYLLGYMGAPQSLRLFVVEDQELFRSMLINLCTKVWKFQVVGAAGTLADTIQNAPAAAPDVILLDLQLPDGDGLEVIPRMFEAIPDVRIVAVTSIRDEVTIHRLLQTGIQGFVDKTGKTPEVLFDAICAVADGGSYFSEVVLKVQRKMREDPLAFNKVLSPREQETLVLLAQGLSNGEVGDLLGVATWTVHSHRRNIMRKLNLANESELIRYAIKKGFIRPEADRP